VSHNKQKLHKVGYFRELLSNKDEVHESIGNDPENSPTVTLGGTVAGTVLGTAAYMSLEQAKGKRVDKRADIWSWGVVVYELLTGEQMFQGEDAAETLVAVIHKQPDLKRVPAKLRRLLGACLQKDPKLRLRDIGDAEQLLAEETVTAPWQPRLGIIFAVTALLLVAFAALGFVAWNNFRQVPPPIVKYSFPPPENGIFPQAFPTMQVLPDGRHIAFQVVARGKWELWVRDLDSPSPRMPTVVENRPEQPFWAPDSHRLGFFDGDKLKKVDITGRPALAIADTGGNRIRSGSWNRDDVIVFASPNTPVFRVPAAGGSPEPLTELDKDGDETPLGTPGFSRTADTFCQVAWKRALSMSVTSIPRAAGRWYRSGAGPSTSIPATCSTTASECSSPSPSMRESSKSRGRRASSRPAGFQPSRCSSRTFFRLAERCPGVHRGRRGKHSAHLV
jgi:hypothetical protein